MDLKILVIIEKLKITTKNFYLFSLLLLFLKSIYNPPKIKKKL